MYQGVSQERNNFVLEFHIFPYMDICRYSVTFRAENGGFRILDNGGGKQYYTGRTTTSRIDLKVDTETPYHCSEKSECTYPVSDMMSVQNDVTKVIC